MTFLDFGEGGYEIQNGGCGIFTSSAILNLQGRLSDIMMTIESKKHTDGIDG